MGRYAKYFDSSLASKANILSTDCMFGPKEILKSGKLGHLCKVENVNEMSKNSICFKI